MDGNYIDEIKSTAQLTDIEERVLKDVGIRSSEELISLAWNFPSLGQGGLNLAKLSHIANLSSKTAGFARAVQQFGFGFSAPPSFPFGAEAPPNVPGTVGYQVPLSPPRSAMTGGPQLPPSGIIDLRFPGWAVRNQGVRGTCVAFALVACREHLAFEVGTQTPLSEQYLYWATKTQIDPHSTIDGTRIEFAQDALDQHGTCLTQLWQYNGHSLPGNISHGTANDPSSAAQADAPNWRVLAAQYARSIGFGGNAAVVLNALQTSGRPVAISVPVFADPTLPAGDNWNTATALAYGRVLDPPPTSIAITGHAVCVTGYVPDSSEPCGGWFIFRNSWGSIWGTALPAAPPYYAPEVGYGQISASYVDNFLMEMCQL
jgi:hypothetical protein